MGAERPFGSLAQAVETYYDDLKAFILRRTGSPSLAADVLASYRLTEAVTATLNVNNIFDKTYYSSIGAIGYYGEPRNVLLSVKASF
ncbi:hypothetical protein CKO38_13000 [Rhodospirillum rubrum]|uniref:TonB-dependent receptor n=1 Tax=Rhodospirillum rubrum TaxID=1085 RepID=UPI001EC1A167|nr:TonB-dependent receptor [Rhodospirillum rubrum]MBK1665233.1 hypothetical protein [Rhodospirillum rubrum]MBK1677568.1 hypothetical protein [Rhodospirillum rubrum]